MAAEYVIPDQLGRSLVLEVEAGRELAGVLDLGLAQDFEGQEPLTGPTLLVDEFHRG